MKIIGENNLGDRLIPFEISRRNHISLIYRFRQDIEPKYLYYAVDKALEVYPYMGYNIIKENGKYFFVDKGLKPPIYYGKKILKPIVDAEDGHLVTINFTNDQLFVTFSHALCDGKGAEMFAETILWFYCDKAYGGIEKVPFINIKPSPDFFKDVVYSENEAKIDFDLNYLYEKSYSLPYIGQLEEDVGIIAQVRIDENNIMDFVSKNHTSPTAALFLLFSETVVDLYPDEDTDGVISADVMADIRKVMGVDDTIKNALSMARVFISREDLVKKDFEENARNVRNMIKRQITKECINYKHYKAYNYVPPTFLMSYTYNRSGINFLEKYVSDFVLTESGTRKIDYAVFNGCFTINFLFDDVSSKFLDGFLRVLDKYGILYNYTTVRTLKEEV